MSGMMQRAIASILYCGILVLLINFLRLPKPCPPYEIFKVQNSLILVTFVLPRPFAALVPLCSCGMLSTNRRVVRFLASALRLQAASECFFIATSLSEYFPVSDSRLWTDISSSVPNGFQAGKYGATIVSFSLLSGIYKRNFGNCFFYGFLLFHQIDRLFEQPCGDVLASGHKGAFSAF